MQHLVRIGIWLCAVVGGLSCNHGFAQWSLDPDFGQQGRITLSLDSVNLPIALQVDAQDSLLFLLNTGGLQGTEVNRDVALAQFYHQRSCSCPLCHMNILFGFSAIYAGDYSNQAQGSHCL